VYTIAVAGARMHPVETLFEAEKTWSRRLFVDEGDARGKMPL
jgi:hypothetical protein